MKDRSLIPRRGRQTIRRATTRLPKSLIYRRLQGIVNGGSTKVDLAHITPPRDEAMLRFCPMKAPSIILRRSLCAAVALASLCAYAGDESGEPAPRFRAKTTTGAQFNNESIKGKVVLFEF